ncbi:hypothetical protein E1B28_007139 [Marasmius oreades]|uniref:Protein kinase domain-containing protein n=1 Tax=Marasmius oreades TaxID=181124 RepID=A0A9P7S2Q9_9AGAR|nr:uncharacterized protein E1B28_007139 [Marasmius oreades]KAG7093463.1 hypothetical protein E1B28_007139 [Marasmius oreades]
MLHFVKCMKDVLRGLFYLRLAGYVHRDISPGNTLFHVDLKQGKVSDVDFGKHESSCTVHDPITGTKDFMAVEYARGTYLYTFEDSPYPWTGSFATLPLSVDVDTRVIFNYYHDVESVAWIYLWFLYHCFPSPIYGVLTPNKQAELCKLYEGWEYFQDKVDQRVDIIDRHLMWTLVRNLRSIYEEYEDFVTPLALFLDLKQAYQKLEKEPQQPRTQDSCFHWPRSLFSLELYEIYIARF